jgi:hypothetical protein
MTKKKTKTAKHAKDTGEKSVQIEKSGFEKKYLLLLLIIILAAVPFLLGKYFELNSPDPFDSGSNVYSAKRVLDGAVLGVDEKPGAALGTLLVNMLGVSLFGFNEFGPKLLQGIFQAAALIMMFFTINKIFGKLAAAIGVIVSSIYLSAPVIAKFGNVKEEFMAAVMVIGICLFILRQLGGRWYLAFLSGAVLVWAPLFKPTGMSCIVAVGIFVLAQPIFKHRTWKQTFTDIMFLLAGAIASVIPVSLWLIMYHKGNMLPYEFAWKMLPFNNAQNPLDDSYIATSQELVDISTLTIRNLRYYLVLILPVSLAVSAIFLRLIRISMSFFSAKKIQTRNYDRFVLLLAVWWLLDMAFVWVSPRSYEQYYIPLNASGAMLGCYAIALYSDAFKKAVFKGKWVIIGISAFILMVIMSWPIFFGITKSPFSGQKYDGRQRGYQQKHKEIKDRKEFGYVGAWEKVGEYIRQNSTSKDVIYVWGWYPGIYINSQRLSPCPVSFISEMHVKSPQQLSEIVDELLNSFKKQPPLFIVDSRKIHFPWNRPPLELWPSIQKKLIPADSNIIKTYESQYAQMLKKEINNDEDLRFTAMKPLRDYIMTNYKPVGFFGEHVLFELKNK